jgi:hypothetical protein
MTSPYKNHLKEYLDMTNEVTVDRAGAASITGKVVAIEDDACTIRGKSELIGYVKEHFIAYDDIRGVSTVEHDID